MTPASAVQLEPETDTEITLGTGKMLGLFFGLVILCALFFGMGFTMGKNSVKSAPELLATPSGARPSAGNREVAPAPPVETPQQQAANPSATTSAPADSNSSSAASPQTAAPAQNSQPAQQGAEIPTQPGPGYFVQVAAVSKQEDAEALVDALKSHQYAAMVSSNSGDKLFHVQIGPFTDIKDAEAIRTKLVSDGYNPILKK
jgi:cell division septation protein DedD